MPYSNILGRKALLKTTINTIKSGAIMGFVLICNSDRTVACEDSEKYLSVGPTFLQLASPEFRPRSSLMRTKIHSTFFRVDGLCGRSQS